MINKFVAGLTAMALCAATQGCFCGSIRTHATVSTQDYGGNIFTKYRYRIIEVKGVYIMQDMDFGVAWT